jgi:ABC-type multidrug transport system ATPase subunit
VFAAAIGRDGLLGSATRVLVTHNVAVLAQLDYVLVLKDGRMETFGTPEHVLPGLDLATVDVGEEQHEEKEGQKEGDLDEKEQESQEDDGEQSEHSEQPPCSYMYGAIRGCGKRDRDYVVYDATV